MRYSNIIDGTNLERNLYLTTQLTELGIPVVIAINMMDIVRKKGDKINIEELSRELGCKIIEISALKGDGVMDAAEAAIDAAKNGKTVPMHTFSGPVEHAIAHIEEAALHSMSEDQQRWYAIKIFERDDKALAQLKIDASVMEHIESDIKAAETELDDDAESIITNERYIYIAQLIKNCYKKKEAGALSTSDKIDKIVTNRWLGLPIFALVMFLVYWVAMVGVGAPATDWANDGVFGDGWHLFGIGSAAYNEVADEWNEASAIVDGYDAYVEENGEPADGVFTYEVEDEETLAVEEVEATVTDYEDAQATLEEIGEEPDPADYGVWVPSIPTLIGDGLEAAGTADWLSGLILDGIVAGVGAVLGFVPQMLVLFLMLAFLEACGYMARIAFVLDRIFRKFGLSGKSFIPMLIGTGCGVPGVMASRTIENERDRRMTIMTTTFIPCGAKVPFIAMIAGAIFNGCCMGRDLRILHRHGSHHRFRHHAQEDQDVLRRACSLRYGAARLPLADSRQRSPFHVGARLVLHQEGRYDNPSLHHLRMVHHLLRLWLTVPSVCSPKKRSDYSILATIGNAIAWIFIPLGWGNWQAAVASITGLVAKENIVGTLGILYASGVGTVYQNLAAAFTSVTAYSFLVFNLLCAPCFAAIGAIKREMNSSKWTWFAIGYQCGFAYICALMVNQFGGLFTGNVNVIGLIVAIAALAGIIYMLAKPYKEATKLSEKL